MEVTGGRVREKRFNEQEALLQSGLGHRVVGMGNHMLLAGNPLCTIHAMIVRDREGLEVRTKRGHRPEPSTLAIGGHFGAANERSEKTNERPRR